MKFTPYEHQVRGHAALVKVLDRYGAALDASPCGAGKTLTAAMVAHDYAMPVGVLCIRQARQKWIDTLREFRIEPVFAETREKLRRGSTPWVRRNAKKFAWNFRGLLIADEVHMDSAMDSLNASMLAAARDMPTLMLSATVAESPLQMRSIGFQLGLHGLKNFWTWAQAFGARKGLWGGLEFDKFDEANRAHLLRLHELIFPLRGFRVSEAELRHAMPEHLIVNEPLDLSAADRKKLEELYAVIDEEGLQGAAACIRERQEIELLKLPAMCEEACAIADDGGAVILFLNFQAGVDRAKELLPGAGVIDGRVKDADREAARLSFQRGDTPFIIVNTVAGGQSIDLHDTEGGRPRFQLFSPQYGGKADDQALGRAVRVGAKSRVLSKRLYVPGTVEERVVESLEAKRDNIKIINSGTPMDTQETSTVVGLIHAEREHAEHSPSSLLYKSQCPGFRNDPTSDKTLADEGSIGHEAFEKGHTRMIPPEKPWLIAAAEKTIAYGQTVRAKHGPGAQIFKEIKVPYMDQFGWLDEFIFSGNRGDLMDPKFSKNEYKAASPQFFAYVLALFQMFPPVDEITVHVIMPYLDIIDIEVFTRADMERLTLETLAVVERAKRNDPADYRMGEYCSYCGQKAKCPKLTGMAHQIALRYNPEELQIPAELQPENIKDPFTMARAKLIAPILAKWAAKVDDAALALRLNEGVEISDGEHTWELAEKNASFKVENAQIGWEVAQEFGLTPEAYAACGKVDIGKIEEAVARLTPRGKIKAAKERLRDRLIEEGAAQTPGTYHYLKRVKTPTCIE